MGKKNETRGRKKQLVELQTRISREVKKGRQGTLVRDSKGPLPLPRLLTAAEAEELYHRALAEIWGVPVERIRSRSWALPVITYTR